MKFRTEVTDALCWFSLTSPIAGVQVRAGGRRGQGATAEHSNLTGSPSSTSTGGGVMAGSGSESEEWKNNREASREKPEDVSFTYVRVTGCYTNLWWWWWWRLLESCTSSRCYTALWSNMCFYLLATCCGRRWCNSLHAGFPSGFLAECFRLYFVQWDQSWTPFDQTARLCSKWLHRYHPGIDQILGQCWKCRGSSNRTHWVPPGSEAWSLPSSGINHLIKQLHQHKFLQSLTKKIK